MEFKDLEFKEGLNNGVQALKFFKNRYGVSVIRHDFSYTDDDTWEIAILQGTKEKFSLCYSTHITDDVLGHQTDEDVTEVLKQVKELK